RLDVGIDGAFAAVEGVFPGAIEQLRAAEDGPGATQQFGKQGVFVAGQVQQYAVETDPARGSVVFEAAVPEGSAVRGRGSGMDARLARCGRMPAQPRPPARRQIAQGE